MEREIALKDIFVIVLKKARQVLVWTLVFGILLGAYGVYRSYGNAEEGNIEEAEKYAQDVENAEKAIVCAEGQVEELKEYLADSLYYAIDPYNKGVSNLLFYVDTGYEVNPSFTYQTPDRTSHVVAAYTTMYRYDEGILQEIYQLLGKEVDKKYVFELISVNDQGDNLVNISVVHQDAEIASAIAHCIFENTKARVQETVAEHTTQILADYAGYEIDTDMRKRQDASGTNLVNAYAGLAQRKEELKALEKNPVEAQSGAPFIIKSVVKFGIIGLVIGCLVGCVVAVFGAFMSGRLQNAADILSRYKFPLLGTLPQDTKGRWFDKWIRNLEGEPKSSYADASKVVAANLRAVAGDKKIVLVSTGDKIMLAKLAGNLGDQVQAGGNLLQEASVVETLGKTDAVVLVEERGKAQLEQIDGEILRLKALNKEILGIVLC